MSEYEAYYQAFSSGYWAHPDPEICRCKGSGWVVSELDTFHGCRYHKGRHPEDTDPYPGDDDYIEPEPELKPLPIEDDELPF